MLRTASKLLGIPASSLTLRDGRVAVTDATAGGISYRELAARAINELSTEMILTNSYKSDSNPGSYAVNFAEAEVDTLTGLVKITDFLSVNDIGQAINRQMVFNQIGGGVQMAAGFALCEDLGINSKGVPTKDSLKNTTLSMRSICRRSRLSSLRRAAIRAPSGQKASVRFPPFRGRPPS